MDATVNIHNSLTALLCFGATRKIDSSNYTIKIKTNSSKFIYLGVIYRHPNQQFDDFGKDLNGLLTNFNLSNNEYIITGDFNIDLLKSTSDNKVGRYYQNLESHGCKPLITTPRFSSTVSPSLLDHIYCKLRNTTQTAGIAIFDVSDHLPIFFLFSTSINRKSEKQIIRCMKNFNLENFLVDLEEALFPWNFNSGSTVHDAFDEFIHIFQTIINEHAPLRKLSRREKQLQTKPWITRGLLTSIKNKNRMFRKCYKCKDAKLIAQYKKYTNKLTRLRKIAKQQYYFKLFQNTEAIPKKHGKLLMNCILHIKNSLLMLIV